MRTIEHTADTGIEVEGATLEECFARAAAGMFATFTEGRGAADRRLDIELSASSRTELLVAWLEELLFRSEVAGLLLLTFDVLGVTETRLRARAAGRRLGPEDEAIGPAVKAVTRHELALDRIDGRWHARVIFDV